MSESEDDTARVVVEGFRMLQVVIADYQKYVNPASASGPVDALLDMLNGVRAERDTAHRAGWDAAIEAVQTAAIRMSESCRRESEAATLRSFAARILAIPYIPPS